MIEPRLFPTPKRYLFRIHKDLRRIVTPLEVYADDLTEIEVLVLLLEDRRFFQHRGVDMRSLGREVLRAMTFRKHGGASTVDMQFVRTRTGYREITLRRKLYEMLLAYLLQFHMGKLSILRAYLEVVYLGWGMRGIRNASQQVFEKEVWQLDLKEAAFIAAMMVYPRPRRPSAIWKEKVERRAAYGLRLFSKLGGGYKQRLN